MHAVKKYNPNIGVRFSGYAKLWIKAYIQEYIIKTWSIVKIGTTVAQKKLFFHLKKVKESILSIENKASLSSNDYEVVARELSVSSSEVKEMDLRLNKGISLEAPIGNEEESGMKVLDYLEDATQNTELLVLNNDTDRKKQKLLKKAISQLNSREAEIITNRHLKERADTLDILSKKYNISRERVRQIESAALAKITEYCQRHYIESSLS